MTNPKWPGCHAVSVQSSTFGAWIRSQRSGSVQRDGRKILSYASAFRSTNLQQRSYLEKEREGEGKEREREKKRESEKIEKRDKERKKREKKKRRIEEKRRGEEKRRKE